MLYRPSVNGWSVGTITTGYCTQIRLQRSFTKVTELGLRKWQDGERISVMYPYNHHEVEPHVLPLDDGSGFVTDVIYVWCGDTVTEFFPRPVVVFPTKDEALAAAVLKGCEIVDRGYDPNYNPYAQ